VIHTATINGDGRSQQKWCWIKRVTSLLLNECFGENENNGFMRIDRIGRGYAVAEPEMLNSGGNVYINL